MADNPGQYARSGLTGWFIGNHVGANLLMLFLLIGGLFSALGMRTELFPTIDPRTITVRVPYPGASPHEVEDGITSRIEEAVIGVEGIEKVTSVAQENLGVVILEVEQFADTGEVLDNVKNAVDQLVDFPPRDAEAPIVTRISPQPSVITLVLYGHVPELTLKGWGERLKDEMLREPGISLVELSGVRDYEISIEISERMLREYGLTISEVGRIVEASSLDLPAGTVESEAGDILLRIQEKRRTGEAFENIVIRSMPDGSLLRLSDIADIVDGFVDENLITRYNGMPGVFIEVSRSESQDSLEVERAVQRYLKKLKLPAGIAIAVLENRTEILKQRINLLARNALLGYALVFLLLMVFLDLKLAFWTSTGIPISFFGGLLIVNLFGMSFNMITLFALIVVLGIVVDDAIVTGESIFAEQEAGREHEEAALSGVMAIRAPVTIGVLTSVAAFAPLAFTRGILGQILRPIPIFVISILIVSLIEVFTILPAHLSSSRRWSRGVVSDISRKVNGGMDRFLDKRLLPVLEWAIRFRYAVLAFFIAVLIVMTGFLRAGIIRFIFFPQIEGDQVTATLVMPVGTPFEVTRKNALQILDAAERVGRDLEEKQGKPLYQSTSIIIGSAFAEEGPGAGTTVSPTTSNRAQLRIQLVDSPRRAISAGEVENRLRQAVGAIPNADELSFESSLVTGGADLTIQLAHEDVAVLERASELMMNRMQSMDGVAEITGDLKKGALEYVFELTPAGLSAGLNPADIGRQLRDAFYGYEVQRVQRRRTELRVMVRYPRGERDRLRAISDFRITLPNGEKAPLETMTRIRQQRTYSQIRRVDGRRVVNVTADVDGRITTPDEVFNVIMNQVVPEIESRYPGVEASPAGETEERQRDLASLGRNMLTALLIIFVMLGGQLKSYFQPFIIMAIIPFGVVGAFLGHLLLGYDLSFISLFGIVALTGVVINDSVVLIDYFNRQRNEAGKDIHAAMMEAVRRRFRPIILTTMTTSLALLPMLLETSLQARFLIPMAISLAFGLLFASVILVFLLPILIRILNDLQTLPRKIRG